MCPVTPAAEPSRRTLPQSEKHRNAPTYPATGPMGAGSGEDDEETVLKKVSLLAAELQRPAGDADDAGDAAPEEASAPAGRKPRRARVPVGDPAAQSGKSPSQAVDLSELFRHAGIPPTACPVEEVIALRERYGDMEPEVARRALLAALEFRPGVTADAVLQDGQRKLEALRQQEAKRRSEAERLHRETMAAIEEIRVRTLSEAADLEQRLAELHERLCEVRSRGEAEIEALAARLADSDQSHRQADAQIRKTMQRLQTVMTLLGASDLRGSRQRGSRC